MTQAEIKGAVMAETTMTAREIFETVMANPARKGFGFGRKAALVNVDLQRAYTDIKSFATAYQTDPRQIEHINRIAAKARALGWPVVWTRVCFHPNAQDAGVWGTRTDTPDSLQNIKCGSPRHAFDPRVESAPETDMIFDKRMPSAFFESPLGSLLVWHQVDTVIVSGGSTSGCIRATAIDSLSRGYRTIVPIECVADKHESYHYANLTDLQLKYADVVTVAEVDAHLDRAKS